MIRAAIRAAKKEGAAVVEVKIGDEATVRIPLAPDRPIAELRRSSCNVGDASPSTTVP